MSEPEASSREESETEPEADSGEAYSIDPVSKEETSDLANLINKKREDTRSQLARFFLCILGGTYLLSFFLMIGVILTPFFIKEEHLDDQLRNDTYTYTKDIISIFITTQTGLVGSVMGFYFGSNQAQNQSKGSNQ